MVSTLGKPSDEKAAAHQARGAGYMAKPNAAQLAEIGRLIDDGKVCPMVDAIFPLAEARAAQEHLENKHVRGKVVLKAAD
jgi:NADPH:quinone reductase-like Zn-dependent oxidoreductase